MLQFLGRSSWGRSSSASSLLPQISFRSKFVAIHIYCRPGACFSPDLKPSVSLDCYVFASHMLLNCKYIFGCFEARVSVMAGRQAHCSRCRRAAVHFWDPSDAWPWAPWCGRAHLCTSTSRYGNMNVEYCIVVGSAQSAQAFQESHFVVLRLSAAGRTVFWRVSR